MSDDLSKVVHCKSTVVQSALNWRAEQHKDVVLVTFINMLETGVGSNEVDRQIKPYIRDNHKVHTIDRNEIEEYPIAMAHIFHIKL